VEILGKLSKLFHSEGEGAEMKIFVSLGLAAAAGEANKNEEDK